MKGNCCVNIVIGLILGVITAVLVELGIITEIFILFSAILAISALILTVLVAILLFGHRDETKCLCHNQHCLIYGILGGIVFGLIGIIIVEFSFIVTLLAVTFFFIGLLGLKDLLICFIRRICCR